VSSKRITLDIQQFAGVASLVHGMQKSSSGNENGDKKVPEHYDIF
jgi:hypothetical protein